MLLYKHIKMCMHKEHLVSRQCMGPIHQTSKWLVMVQLSLWIIVFLLFIVFNYNNITEFRYNITYFEQHVLRISLHHHCDWQYSVIHRNCDSNITTKPDYFIRYGSQLNKLSWTQSAFSATSSSSVESIHLRSWKLRKNWGI